MTDAKEKMTHTKLQAENQRLQQLLAKMQQQIESQCQVIEDNTATIDSLSKEIQYLNERLAILLSKRYRAQSEQLKHIQGQLFDEAELEKAIADTLQAIEEQSASVPATSPSEPKQSSKEQASKPKRKKLPEHLRRVDIVIDVSDEEKQAMGDDWVYVGDESAEKLAVQQREYYVKVLKRKKYVRKNSVNADKAEAQAEAAAHGGIKVASPAKVILPKAIADASLLADVLCSKFIDAMSFYRTEKRLKREGIDIGYSTLCDWPIQLYARMKPFEALFYEAIGQSQRWQLDETTLQVLDEPGRANQTKSYLWGIRAGPPDGQQIVLFHYDESRSYAALSQWLQPCLTAFNGVITTDEHAPYDILVEKHPNIVAHGGCLAHCRRKFSDAAKGRRHSSDAHEVLKKIALIYSQHNRLGHLSGEALLHARQECVKPLMKALKDYLDGIAGKYLEKGQMKTAIGYALNNWPKFTAFLDHADLPIDNNLMEQTIRPFTIGRKNFLFAGSPRGAEASAFIYSLIESAKVNGLEPFGYLNALFEAYPLATNDEERRLLLPWNFKFSNLK